MGGERQTLFFTLPNSLEKLKILRFDPADRSGFFHLHRLTLRQASINAEEGCVLWEAAGGDIEEVAILENIHYFSSIMGDVFFSVGDTPQIIIELPKSVTEQSGQGRLQFEVVMDWLQSSDYLAALDEMRIMRRLMVEKQRRADKMYRRIDVLEHKMDAIQRTYIGKILRWIKFSPFQF